MLKFMIQYSVLPIKQHANANIQTNKQTHARTHAHTQPVAFTRSLYASEERRKKDSSYDFRICVSYKMVGVCGGVAFSSNSSSITNSLLFVSCLLLQRNLKLCCFIHCMCMTITPYLPFIDRFPSIPLISRSWMLCYFIVVVVAGIVDTIATVEKGMLEFLFVRSLLCSLLLLPRLECVCARMNLYIYICFMFFYVHTYVWM